MKFSFECDTPLEFYKVIAAVHLAGPLAAKFLAVEVDEHAPAAEEADDETADKPAAKKRGRPRKAATKKATKKATQKPQSEEQESESEPEDADDGLFDEGEQDAGEEEPEEITAQMAYDAVKEVFTTVSTAKATEICKRVFQAERPSVQVKAIEEQGLAEELYRESMAALKAHEGNS